MPVKQKSTEYQTIVVGAGCMVKEILSRLGFVEAIDSVLKYQPEVETTYGVLAQVLVVNRLNFQPVPLYAMAEWAAQHWTVCFISIPNGWMTIAWERCWMGWPIIR